MKSKIDINNEIEKLIDYKLSKGEEFNKNEIEFISKYTGWGGTKQAGKVGLIHEFFTPQYICKFMYDLAIKYGYNKGNILEPSAGIGAMIKEFYDTNNYKTITVFEISKYSSEIIKAIYPKIEVFNNFFETAFLEYPRFSTINSKGLTWLNNYPYDLVIGNPPYSKNVNLYSSYFKKPIKFKQAEMFFIFKGLQLLKQGGILIYITSSNFLSSGLESYYNEKNEIGKLAELLEAIRLPSIFDNTGVPTDIIILKKK